MQPYVRIADLIERAAAAAAHANVPAEGHDEVKVYSLNKQLEANLSWGSSWLQNAYRIGPQAKAKVSGG